MYKLNVETKRLVITELRSDMAQSVYENSQDDDMRRFVPDEVFSSVEEARGALEHLISCYEKGGPLVYEVQTKRGENIGYVQAVPLGGEWEIGYHIAKAHTGNGYATEAVKAFLPVIMGRLGIDKIYGVCLAENGASRTVLKKCGFALMFQGVSRYQGETREICRFLYERTGTGKTPEAYIIYEKAAAGDIDTLIKLRLEYLRDDRGELDDPVTDAIAAQLRDYFKRQLGVNFTAFLARTREEAIACVYMAVAEKPANPAFITGRTATILNVYTKPLYRRRGIATRLLEMAIDEAKTMNLSYLELSATKAGRPIYEKLGFAKRQSEYTEMKLSLI